MQWLINITTALFDDRHRFFDRGDPAAWDFQVGDFIQDNVWRDFNLSGIVPATAQAVLLHMVIRSAVIDKAINFRTKGNVNVFNVTRTACLVANIRNSVDLVVHPDSDRLLQYKILGGPYDVLNVIIGGWWLE